MNKYNVLIVEDDAMLRKNVQEILEAEGYVTFTAFSGAEAMHILRAKKMDAVLLDLMLPDMDGLTLMGNIRGQSTVPVIVVSGKGSWTDKVVGLEVGADDYIGKPFEERELLARVKACIRHSSRAINGASADTGKECKIRFDRWTLDPGRLQAYTADGLSANLTASEYRILELLAKNSGNVLTRGQLLDACASPDITDRAIDIRITRIRKKICTDPAKPALIKTVRNVGYIMDCSAETLT